VEIRDLLQRRLIGGGVGAKLSQEQIKAQGGNSSLIHIEWMIGSDKVDIDGLKPDGSRVAVMRQGEWA
ncbi:aminopeptidase, partial [Rhizobium ruizarguesonis]